MSTPYEPLSVRRGLRAKVEGYPGIPPAARFSIRHWLEGVYGYRSKHGMDESLMGQVALAVGLSVTKTYETGRVMEQILGAAEGNDDLYLDVLDATLAYTANGGRQPLRDALDASGSLWRVKDDGEGLESRVDAATAEAVAIAVSPSDEASAELMEAWTNIHSLSPDPSDAWDHAIKAVEAVMIPLVIPTKAKPTLGLVLIELEKNPQARTVLLETSHKALGRVETLVGMLRFIWPNPDRHAGAAKRVPSLQEAEAVVQLAVAVVQWVRQSVVT